MQWYYAINGERHGPVDGEEMARLLQGGTVDDTTMVWQEGMGSWLPWGEVDPSRDSGVEACESFQFEGVTVHPGNKAEVEQRLREGTLKEGVYREQGGGILAPFSARFWAYLVDSLIVYLPYSLFFVVATPVTGLNPGPWMTFSVSVASFLLIIVLPCVYETWMVSTYRATLGKMMFNLEVVNLEFAPISLARSFGRYCGKLFLGSCWSFLPYAAVFFTEKRQAVHDTLSSTLVVQR